MMELLFKIFQYFWAFNIFGHFIENGQIQHKIYWSRAVREAGMKVINQQALLSPKIFPL